MPHPTHPTPRVGGGAGSRRGPEFGTLFVLLKMLPNSDHNLLQTNEHKNTVFENHHLQHVFNLTPQNKVSKYEQADLRLGEGRRAGLPNHHLKQE
jgi:hypothetical protein